MLWQPSNTAKRIALGDSTVPAGARFAESTTRLGFRWRS